jgi:hypothetical protein
MCKSGTHKGVLRLSNAGYLLLVNVVLENKFKGSKANAIISENKNLNTKGFAFIPND